jgi:2-C-methyl-D-erythritol 4-phosphate cytidylyltransferase
MDSGKSKYALIVAGGSGTRIGTDVPKQFIPLGSKPILMYTIQRFADYSKDLQIILVLPSSQIPEWEKLTKEYSFSIKVKIVAGGATRFQSVKNGLDSIPEPEGLVAIHDGVRPFVNRAIIDNSFLSASKFGCGISSVALKDSIRYVNKDINRSEDRGKFRLIQTPQTFQLSLIKKAFLTKESADFTDDASVLEHSGNSIHLIEGAYENIKITTPEDLVISEAILKNFTY